MKLNEFDYPLDESLIAQEPMEERDKCKLLLVNREDQSITDKHFFELVDILGPNDVLVMNQSKVIPARLLGNKTTGGRVEVLLVKQLSVDSWEIITKPGLKEGAKIKFGYSLSGLVSKVGEEGVCVMEFDKSGAELMLSFESVGKMPLPPYIKSDKEESELREVYQTVFAKEDGSVAAPTAGFHFTADLIEKLLKKGVQIEYVTLHVSLGTFRPVKVEDIAKHQMHAEWFSLSKDTAERLNTAKSQGKRIIAVGTTTSRVLESSANDFEMVSAAQGETDIYIYPPYKFKFVDGLITNFHLPKTTLLLLVSALISAPNTNHVFDNFHDSLIGKAYRHATEQKYQFFSFGDAMLIL
jgi:S-adenosylmethionine:tRNA ribosyltransferase-isomerase